jgi:uncharacterized repeat protein (TIGR04138 family)
MSPTDVPFWDAVDQIRESDPRFRREAYGFLLLALGTTVNGLSPERQADPARRHLSGAELLHGMVALARNEFGAMAPAVFREWGVRASSDVGDMVFQLVECGQLSARPEDKREDFHGFDLMGLLAEGSGGEPARKRPRPSPGGAT